MDRNNPDSWYEDPNGDDLQKYGFMRQMHTPAMWRVRQSPKIHRAFADLWGTDNLRGNIDRCIFKPPLRADRPEWGVPTIRAVCCTGTSRRRLPRSASSYSRR